MNSDSLVINAIFFQLSFLIIDSQNYVDEYIMSTQITGTFEETLTLTNQSRQANAIPNSALQNTLVTIIIPTHNYGHLISETINSVFEQTYKNIEVIVVDDGSNDNTEEVVTAFPEIKYIYQTHKGNHTPARAANNGLLLSKGEFVICLGADDKLSCTYVEKCLDIMRRNPRVGIVFTGTQEFGAANKTRFPRKLRHKYSILRHPHGQLGAMMVRRSVYFQPDYTKSTSDVDTANKKSLHEPVGLYDEKLHSLDDWDFTIRVSMKGWKIVSIHEILHATRVHSGRVTEHADESELHRKYPFMRGYIVLSRIFDVFMLSATRPMVFLNRIYNKGIVKLLHVTPKIEPPTNYQHEWVNEKSILKKIQKTKPTTVIDCGCGSGRWGYLLRDLSVVGIDRYKPYLLQAKLYEQVVCASASHLPFRSNCFDSSLAVELIEHLPKLEGALMIQEMKRVSKKGIIITTPKKFAPINYGEGHPETHRSLWTKYDVMACLNQN